MTTSNLSPIPPEHYFLSAEEREFIHKFRGLSADSKRIILKRVETFSRWDKLTIEQQEDLIKKVPRLCEN